MHCCLPSRPQVRSQRPPSSVLEGWRLGMFSTTEGSVAVSAVFVTAPGRAEEIAIAPSLEDAAARAAVLPGTHEFARLARRVVERERRNGRPVEQVHIETWRTEYAPVTLAAVSRRIGDFVHRVDATAAPRW